jgi:hypothetical protein
MSVAIVGKFDNFGSIKPISPPEKPTTFNDFSVKFREEILPNIYPSLPAPATGSPSTDTLYQEYYTQPI